MELFVPAKQIKVAIIRSYIAGHSAGSKTEDMPDKGHSSTIKVAISRSHIAGYSARVIQAQARSPLADHILGESWHLSLSY